MACMRMPCVDACAGTEVEVNLGGRNGWEVEVEAILLLLLLLLRFYVHDVARTWVSSLSGSVKELLADHVS